MRNARQLREEAMALFDDGDSRTFEDIYGKGQIFEDNEDIIHPKMRKLFEEVHEASRPIQGASRRMRETEELQEETEQLDESEQLEEEAPKYDLASTKDTPRPSGDGVSNSHNPPLSNGPTSQVTQSGARQDDNSKLGNEPPMGFGAGPRKRQQEQMVKLFEEVYNKTLLESKTNFLTTKRNLVKPRKWPKADENMIKLFEEVYANVNPGENAEITRNRLEESKDVSKLSENKLKEGTNKNSPDFKEGYREGVHMAETGCDEDLVQEFLDEFDPHSPDWITGYQDFEDGVWAGFFDRTSVGE